MLTFDQFIIESEEHPLTHILSKHGYEPDEPKSKYRGNPVYTRNESELGSSTHHSSAAVPDSKGHHERIGITKNFKKCVPHHIQIYHDPTDIRWAHYKGDFNHCQRIGDTAKQLDRHLTKTHSKD